MSRGVEGFPGSVAYNTALNLLGQVLPLGVGIVALPFLVEGLGTERFGLLSLVWAALGSFGLFDFGMGRATTKFAAEALEEGREARLPALFWTSLSLHVVVGALGGLGLAFATPFLVEHPLNIPSWLQPEARESFLLLAVSIPVVVCMGVLRGVLEAGQHFDWVNAVKVPGNCLGFLLPLVGVFLNLGLSAIVLLLVLSRVGMTLVYLWLCRKAFPELGGSPVVLASLLRPLASYGGWVTVSNIVGPILIYLDRFLIGTLVGLTAVSYYTAPYEIATRLLVLPTSLVLTLFPAFSALGTARGAELKRLYTSSVRYLSAAMVPLVVVLLVWAEDILRLWLGMEFAINGARALHILSVGVFLNALAHVPFSLLQGLGRPDLTAKFHLVELPLYVCGAWYLVRAWGIEGAALAWTLRVGLDALLLFVASKRLLVRLAPSEIAAVSTMAAAPSELNGELSVGSSLTDLEEVGTCSLCGTEGKLLYGGLRDRIFYVPGKWNFLSCPDCALVWLSPRPTPEEARKLYANYFTHNGVSPIPRLAAVRQAISRAVRAGCFGYPAPSRWGRWAGRCVSWIGPLREIAGMEILELDYSRKTKLLEIGCGGGHFLARMEGLGWDVRGVDFDPEASEAARRLYGLSVHTGTVESAGFREGEFGVVAMSHVIEHASDPLALLRDCRKLLRPGGQLILVTPNLASLGHRLFGSSWLGLETPRHFYLFSPRTLKEYVRRAGLRVDRVRTTAREARHFWYASRLIQTQGGFPGGQMRVHGRLRLEGILFQALGHGLSALSDVGEEIFLVATRA